MLVKLFLCYVFHDTKSRYSMNWSQFYCLYQLNWQIASCNIMDSSSDVIFEMKYWEILWYSLQGSFMKNFIDVFQFVCFGNHFLVIIGFNSLFMTCNSVGNPNLIYIPIYSKTMHGIFTIFLLLLIRDLIPWIYQGQLL